jgi:hypothetical protein
LGTATAAAAAGTKSGGGGAAAAAAEEDLTGPLTLGPAVEETTTPELELVGCYSQDPSMSGLKAGGGRERAGAAVEQEFEASTRQTLFPIFRPKRTRKWVVLVRHGESSEWNCRGGVWMSMDVEVLQSLCEFGSYCSTPMAGCSIGGSVYEVQCPSAVVVQLQS